MKTFNCGIIEVMGNDYQRQLSWADYLYPTFDNVLSELKSNGWRVPTEKEAKYLYSLYDKKNPIGGFNRGTPGIGYAEYFIEPMLTGKRSALLFSFHYGKITHDIHLLNSAMGNLRLVRSI
jgi:hypothetical protein